MISHPYSCIFIHIPKTGGSSIESVIWSKPRSPADLWMGFVDDFHNKYQTGGLQHLLSRHIKLEVGNDVFDKYYKFTIVRNPWDKAASQYSFMSKREDLRNFIDMKRDTSFKKYLELIKLKKHIQWEPQVNFLKDADDKLVVDYIGRFEQLSHCANEIFSHLGIAQTNLPHLHKSVRKPYQDYYDDESIEMIKEMYNEDINEFGYSYN